MTTKKKKKKKKKTATAKSISQPISPNPAIHFTIFVLITDTVMVTAHHMVLAATNLPVNLWGVLGSDVHKQDDSKYKKDNLRKERERGL